MEIEFTDLNQRKFGVYTRSRKMEFTYDDGNFKVSKSYILRPRLLTNNATQVPRIFPSLHIKTAFHVMKYKYHVFIEYTHYFTGFTTTMNTDRSQVLVNDLRSSTGRAMNLIRMVTRLFPAKGLRVVHLAAGPGWELKITISLTRT